MKDMTVFVDITLNHLCRLLRMLNIKCYVFHSLTYKQIKAGDAIIVTRSKEIFKKAQEYGLNIEYVSTTNKYEILSLLMSKHKIRVDTDLNNPRKFCSVCGGELKSIRNISSELIKKYNIPYKVVKFQKIFFVCERCNKVYWYGNHWKNLLNKVQEYRE